MAKRKSKGISSIPEEKNDLTSSSATVDFDLPSISEEKWRELLKSDEEDNTFFRVLFDIYKRALAEDKEDYIKTHIFPFTAMCCHIAWTKIINIYFQRHDPGEHSESLDEKWKADEEPISSPIDSWASHCIPVVPLQIDTLSSTQSAVPKITKTRVAPKKPCLKVSGVPYTREKDDIDSYDSNEQETETDPSPLNVITGTEPASCSSLESSYPLHFLSLLLDSPRHDASSRREVYIRELDNNKQKLLLSLFGKEKYDEFLSSNKPIPKELLDLAIESIPKKEETVVEDNMLTLCQHNFDEEDALGFCLTEVLEFEEEVEGVRKTESDSEKNKIPKIYQKYKTDPLILDKSSEIKNRLQALVKQRVLFNSNMLSKEDEITKTTK